MIISQTSGTISDKKNLVFMTNQIWVNQQGLSLTREVISLIQWLINLWYFSRFKFEKPHNAIQKK